MTSPVKSYDPSGRRVNLIGNGPIAYQFHAEILVKMSKHMTEKLTEQGFSNTNANGTKDDTPINLNLNVSDEVLRLLKHWAYAGGLPEGDQLTLRHLLNATRENEAELKIYGFQDALVDRAIAIIHHNHATLDLDDFTSAVLERLPEWPLQFYNFMMHWAPHLDERDEHIRKVMIDNFQRGKICDQFVQDFVVGVLEMTQQIRDAQPDWVTRPCFYHHHLGRNWMCYRSEQGIDVWKSNTPATTFAESRRKKESG